LVGSTNDSFFGGLIGSIGAELSDLGNPNDQRLAHAGIDFGRQLNDPDLNVNEWIWKNIGDPNQNQASNANSNSNSSGSGSGSGSGSDGSDSSS
jgi:hypothetical protein